MKKRKVVGVKLIFDDTVIGRSVEKVKVCEALAKVEEPFTVKVENISCPVARYVFGMEEEGLENVLLKAKRVKDLEAGKKILEGLYRIEGVKALAFSKFEDYSCAFKPDVLVYILNPNEAYKLIRSKCMVGYFVNAKFSCVVGACSEVIARPFKLRELNVSLGCPGSRLFLKDDEMFVGVVE